MSNQQATVNKVVNMSATMYNGGPAASPKRSTQETDWIPASEKVENEIIKMDSDGETTMVGGINAVHRG